MSKVDVLKYIDENNEINSLEYASTHELDHQDVIGLLKSLESKEMIILEQKSANKLDLTEEGILFTKNGSHEYQVFQYIPEEGCSLDDIKKFNAIGFNKAKAFKWIEINENKLVVKKVDSVVDEVAEDLRNHVAGVEELPKNKIKEYKSRKLVKENTYAYYSGTKGTEFALTIEDQEVVTLIDDEFMERLKNEGSNMKLKKWKFKPNPVTKPAQLHPLVKIERQYRRILIEMGFTEMDTRQYVESCFWNFDALFTPQNHPARDSQDTFYLTEPENCNNLPDSEYVQRVKQVHSTGGYGSQGYKDNWKESEAAKNCLRSHTTSTSARMLYQLAKLSEFQPVKYFSINRVFRNETLDATHLAEFHQVEGVIADRGLGLSHLKSVIRQFFAKLGMKNLRFKPAFNPYTEPSMEIFGYHEGLNKWIEIGNSGMFRPEVLLPMGLPEDVRVLAWGLSLERPTMIMLGLNDIRSLIGPKLDLSLVKNLGDIRVGY